MVIILPETQKSAGKKNKTHDLPSQPPVTLTGGRIIHYSRIRDSENATDEDYLNLRCMRITERQ